MSLDNRPQKPPVIPEGAKPCGTPFNVARLRYEAEQADKPEPQPKGRTGKKRLVGKKKR